jgi:diguanylate cyclase (GGDEF)-like protein/PAS domain S-box-containing protein
MTASTMAYAHFVNDDQETITLGTWSTSTLMRCDATFDTHYPISKAGVWADCFWQRKSVIHNDYAALTTKKGLPEGHAPLLRHVSVPVFQSDKVVLIFGVGNKGKVYDAEDLALIEVLANNLWVLLQRNRSLLKLKLDAEVFRVSREAVVITDASGSIISVNQAFTEITGYAAEEAVGCNPRMLQSGKHDAVFFKKLWEQICQAGHWQGEIWNRRKNGEIYPQWLGITMTKNSANQVSEYIGIFMDITEHKKSQERIEQLGFYDPLTNLANRRLLNERTKQAIGQAQRHKQMVGLIYLDLDHFKDINDSLGHLVGDELLRLVSERLLSCVRDTYTVSRMGGDEFVVLLTRVASPDNVADACRKILLALADVFELRLQTLRISSSIGASIYPADGQSFDELLQHADTAMYQAKAAGRGNFKLFTEAMNQRVQNRLKLQTQMKQSLASDEFYLQYQPQFDLQQQRIVGVEALARWQHPEIGNITPSEFIPVAEESALIIDIGNFVMREACLQAKRWLDVGYRIGMAVNVSYVQFARHNLLQSVVDILQETQLPPELLELELTESILISDPDKVLSVVDQLAAMGVTFSIDDFGTGYSSLSYLKRFSVHKLKIDQSFVRDLLTDPSDAVIVSAIINMAYNLQMQSIAEGVETPEQAKRLGEMGCQQIQGYWFSKPLSAAQMEDLLASCR